MSIIRRRETHLAGLFLVAGLVLLCAGCFNRVIIAPTEDATDTVEDFMDAMVDEDQDDMKDMISPAWLAKNRIDIEKYQVNAYTPEEYEILGPDGKDIKVKLIFESGGTRYLWFRVVIEDDDGYILPGSFDKEWIHPWQKEGQE